MSDQEKCSNCRAELVEATYSYSEYYGSKQWTETILVCPNSRIAKNNCKGVEQING